MFDETLEKVKQYIFNNNFQEITEVTNITTSGIYILYIDQFLSDTIIPIYVGKTSNFQERHKEHLKHLLALNRLDYEMLSYQLNNFNNIRTIFEGKYLYLKIFKYLIDNNLNLDNLHMVIIEKVADVEKLEDIELHYINELKSNYFGFNQLDSVYLKRAYSNLFNPSIKIMDDSKKNMIINTIEKDLNNFEKYLNYGFNKFNYWLLIRSLSGTGYFSNKTNSIITKIKKYYLDILPEVSKDNINNLGDELSMLNNLVKKTEDNLKIQINKIISEEERKKQNGKIVDCIIRRLADLYYYSFHYSLPSGEYSLCKHSIKVISDEKLRETFGNTMEELINYKKQYTYTLSEIYKCEEAILNPLLNYVGSCKDNLLKYVFPNKHFERFSISKKYISIIEKFNLSKAKTPVIVFSFTINKLIYKKLDSKLVYVGLCIPDKNITREWILDNNVINNTYINTVYNNRKMQYFIDKEFVLKPCFINIFDTILSINQEYYTNINDKTYEEIKKDELLEAIKEIREIFDEENQNFQMYVLGSENSKMANEIEGFLDASIKNDRISFLKNKIEEEENV